MQARMQRAAQSRDAKFNNVKAVMGDFENSPAYMQIMAEIEQAKN